MACFIIICLKATASGDLAPAHYRKFPRFFLLIGELPCNRESRTLLNNRAPEFKGQERIQNLKRGLSG